jgi:hypothetical protein
VIVNIEHLLNKALKDIFGKETYSHTSSKLKFPEGLRWCFFSIVRGKKKYLFCWSSVRNENGKFVSWLYQPKRDRVDKSRWTWEIKRVAEHKRRNRAKARARKLLESMKRAIERRSQCQSDSLKSSTQA